MTQTSSTAIPSNQVRIAALYRFAPVEDCERFRARLETACAEAGVRGTLLVAPEGLNGTIAGSPAGIDAVLAFIDAEPGFSGIEVKISFADATPFYRMKVRIKAEIVTMGQPDLDPVGDVGVYVNPLDWNALIADPRTILIDTRNDYEGEIGAFVGAVQPNTRSFRDFPDWFRNEGRALLDQPDPPRVAMYCTGGIRCEKATAFLKAEGVRDVHHLQGGILAYLETVPVDQSLWEGECFVFDERVSVAHGLSVGDHSLCRACRMPVSPQGRASPHYVEGVSCDRCHDVRTEDQRRGYEERRRQIEIAQARGQGHIGVSAPVRPAR